MHSFRGLVNFLSNYFPRLIELDPPLTELIPNNANYRIEEKYCSRFQAIKADFHKKRILKYFSMSEVAILQTDASKKGFRGVILQNGNPIYYVPRALTSAERNYQNLDSVWL